MRAMCGRKQPEPEARRGKCETGKGTLTTG